MELVITSKQKAEYELIKDNFQKRRDEINKDIDSHKIVFEKAKKDISNLEKEVDNLRPKIEGCDNHMVCKKCDIYSMNYLGSSPNPNKYFFYECVICGFEDQHT